MPVGPGQVYRSPTGEPMLFVRTEDRGDGPEHFFRGVRDRAEFELWTAEVPPEFELLNDHAGRAEAEELRNILGHSQAKAGALEETLRDVMQYLSPSQREDARALYEKLVSE